MWKFLFLHCFLSVSSLHSELDDLLSSTDLFFREFHVTDNSNLDPEAVKLLLKRTYNLDNEPRVRKRSLEEDDRLIHDYQGVYMLSNIQDVNKIPVKFPNDINILSFQNLLYIAALEANGSNPENELANDLVLFHYSSIQGVRELGRVPVMGGTKTAMHLYQNTTYIIAAEHEAHENPDFYQGSTVYKMGERSGRVYLEKIQILNVIQPNDLKFWEFQDQLYLAIGTNMGNSSQRTGTLIYRWLGQHFDCLQVIPSKNVKSVTPFTIGSFMYLAVGNFRDDNGNLDINSEIYRFHLQEMKFKHFQSIKTHGAHDISYFNFEDSETTEREHFLIVANSMGKNPNESLTSLKESIVYKFNDNYFIPFQSFRLHGATQWLPIKGPNNEFLLLGSYTNGVVGYQYDGWRFTTVSLQFGQSFFGNNIRAMRTFYYFGDVFLTIADKSSYGQSINLWKLSFSNKNDLEKHYKELEKWCNEMNKNLAEDDFKQVLHKFQLESSDESSQEHEKELQAESYTAADMNEEIRDELEKLNEKTENLKNVLEDAENHVDKYKTESEMPLILGSHDIASLELKCRSKDCCRFIKVKILQMNGENVTDFLANVVPLNRKLVGSVLEFEHVILGNDLTSSLVNGHPFETLVDKSSEVFINSELFVSGTVFINNDLIINSGLFDGVRPDKEHMLLLRGMQNVKEDVIVNNLRVKNLNIFGLLNGMPIQVLLEKPELNLPMDYKELNVNNMVVEGLVGGYNLTKVYEKTLRNSGNQFLQGDVNITSLEADEISVDSDEISNITISSILEALRDQLCQSDPNTFIVINPLESETFQRKSEPKDLENENSADEYVIIVEGLLKAKDFSDETNSVSLLDIVNNSLRLNESVIDSRFEFSTAQVIDLETDFVNEIPFSSWVLKNSPDVQHIRGKKSFSDDIHIREEVVAERINNIDLEQLEGDVLRLKGDQIVRDDLKFNSIKCTDVTTNFTNFGNNTFDKLNRLVIHNSVVADHLEVEDLTLSGEIDSLSWEKILEDSVYEKDVVSEKKTIYGPLTVKNLNITGRINDLLFEEFIALSSTDANKILLDRNITLSKPLNVDELNFEGLLNQVLKPNFEREWLLRDETQIITGPLTFENVHMKLGANLMNETVNNVDLRKLFSKSIKINEDTKIKHLFSLGKVQAQRIEVGNTFNGADFKESIVRSKSKTTQILTGDWFFTRGLTVNGSLIVEGYLSGLNLTHLCNLNPSDKLNVIVGGSLTLKQEPVIMSTVNDMDLTEKVKELWMKNENTTLKGQNLIFNDVEFDNKTTLLGFLNNVNLTDFLKFYLSKTQNRVVSGDYKFENLVINKWCRVHRANVWGTVNGINLDHWVENVLLQDKDQVIGENLRFEKFETGNLNLEGTVNGLNLSKDVLRYDVENAVVEGEKTFPAINVLNLTLDSGRTLQGVNIDTLMEDSVRTTKDVVITGNLEIQDAMFKGPFKVYGKVNGIHFDSRHLLTTKGNQIIRGVKHFDYTNYQDPRMKIRFMDISGKINGIDFDDLMKNQAYSDRNLVFRAPKTLTKGLKTESMEVDGLFHGVNVSGMCHEVFNPTEENTQNDEFYNLLKATKTLSKVANGRAFFFDYFELIQTLKPKIKAVVPTLDTDGNYLLAVFTPNTMKLMDWNVYSESFINTNEVVHLPSNITFVSSVITDNRSVIYIETEKSAKILESKLLKEIETINTSCIAAFRLKSLEKECIFVGEKWNSSRILCKSYLMNELQTYQYLDSKGSVQVSVLTIEDETFISVINKEIVFDKIENTLSIYRFEPKLQHFYVSHTLAEINPVAVSTITYKGNHYLVSAGGHLPESVHNSVLSIFRFNKRHKVFVRSQSIQVDTPVDVHFAILPSSQLALYVLTSNPTKPLVVFLHKGIMGFVEETSGLALYPGHQLYSFTDSKNRHFVIINGFGRGQILKAGFKGEDVLY